MISHDEFTLIRKYSYNQMDLEKFEDAMSYISTDDSYIAEKWAKYKRDEFSFLMNYRGVFNYICRQILDTGYKG